MRSSSDKRCDVLQAGWDEVQKECSSTERVSVVASDQEVVTHSVGWWVLDDIVFASVQVTSPGDRLLDIQHEIVHLGIFIPGKENKTGPDKHAAYMP